MRRPISRRWESAFRNRMRRLPVRDSRNDRAVPRLPFDPREERVIDGLARWMGVLGRFQVLAGGILVLTVLGIAIAYGMTTGTTPSTSSDTTPPLVQLGEVDLHLVIGAGIAVLVLGAVLVRGGVLLTDAAEDLERVVHTDDLDKHHLENALQRLRSYYRMELLLTALILAAVLWSTLPGWS